MREEPIYPATLNAEDLRQSGERPLTSSIVLDCFRQYARERPAVVAFWCLGIGFVLGWKLKPW